MKEVIEKYRNVVIQIGTPYSVGTGFYLKKEDVIITNEHVVRGNREVTIDGNNFPKHTSKVLFTDPLHDVAILAATPELRSNLLTVELHTEAVEQGEPIVAVGHPFGYEYTATQGIISNPNHVESGIQLIQHDAALNPGNSGGPLVDSKGRVVGINYFIMKDGNSVGFSLPIRYLTAALKDYQSETETGARCFTCANVVLESEVKTHYCPHCGSNIELPSMIEDYSPIGIPMTIENFIHSIGHDVKLCRMGPDHWVIREGSAYIKISYNERSGIIYGDAYLCKLPKKNIAPIYEFLLKQNYEVEGLNFSVPSNSQDIVLSLFIMDKYLNMDTGKKLFEHLFKMADYYDNILVEEYNAIPNDGWVRN